jgi:hypothetical protein
MRYLCQNGRKREIDRDREARKRPPEMDGQVMRPRGAITEKAVFWSKRRGEVGYVVVVWGGASYGLRYLSSNRCRQVRRPSVAAMAAAPSGPMLLLLRTRRAVNSLTPTQCKPYVISSKKGL